MNLAVVQTRGREGITAPPVRVEVFFGMGLPGLSLVGMPDASVREAKDRVRAAMLSSQFDFPARRITVNLSPAELPKEGGGFDLAIAIGLLAANAEIPLPFLRDTEFIGELALTGKLQSVRGVLPAVIAALQAGHRVVVPQDDAAVVTSLDGDVYCARTLSEVVAFARGRSTLPLARDYGSVADDVSSVRGDLNEVLGQTTARRALEIAAAGMHHMILYGPPGCGKTMLAERLPSILPALTPEQSMEVQVIASVANQPIGNVRAAPFRAPHHSSSASALIGGGGPHSGIGEITLAHNGVLFLDELSHWPKGILDNLRQPLQSGEVSVSRVRRSMQYPAQFQLVGASNLCPCGAKGVTEALCRCNEMEMGYFRRRLSAALLDRIDLHVEAKALKPTDLSRARRPEASSVVRERVQAARDIQIERAGKPNALLSEREFRRTTKLSSASAKMLRDSISSLQFSARGVHRTLRVARTIADLQGATAVTRDHLHEAVSYRRDPIQTS